MKKIIVAYWHSNESKLKYKDKEEFEYSLRRRNNIINYVLDNNNSVMLRNNGDELIIWIDKYRFGQR